MATISLSLSAKSDKSTGKSEILIRFVLGSRINQRGKSNVFINGEHWNAKEQRIVVPKFRLMNDEQKQLVSELQTAKTQLENLVQHIQQSFIDAGAGKIELSKDWLKTTIHDYYFPLPTEEELKAAEEEALKPQPFFETFEQFIDGSKVSELRKRHYWVVFRALQRFECYNNTKLSFDTITAETLKNFEDYLLHEFSLFEDGELDRVFKQFPETRKLEQRGIGHVKDMMGKLRSFFNWASGKVSDEHNIKINKPISHNPFNGEYSIGTPPKQGTPFFLTLEERDKLYNTELPERLARQRDIFVFQCCIGCRVSDLWTMTWDNVIDDSIRYIPSKTCKNTTETLVVPLCKLAKEILAKYKDNGGSRLFPFVAQQQYNEDIKAMLTEAGITRNVVVIDPKTGKSVSKPINMAASSHMARRTFVGNLYKKVKDPNLIGKLSGHAEGSKAFARYRDIDEETKKEVIGLLD